MREKIEAGTAIDDLRVPDDTGPILRRALDNVEHDAKPATPVRSRTAEPPAADRRGVGCRRMDHEQDDARGPTHAVDDATATTRRARRRAVDRGDLDRRHVRRLLIAASMPPSMRRTPRSSIVRSSCTRRSRCGPSRSARSPTTTAPAGWCSSSTPTSCAWSSRCRRTPRSATRSMPAAIADRRRPAFERGDRVVDRVGDGA